MNKKGFSLSELLVVIAIVALLTVIAVPSVITINKNINKRMYKEKQNKIVAAAELYATNNPDIFNGKDVVQISISDLLKSDYLKQDVLVGDSSCKDNSSTGSNGAEGCIINPVDNTSLNNKIVTIRKNSVGIVAEIGESSEETLQNDTLVERVCNSLKKGTITGKWGTGDFDTCECNFDSSGNVTGIYKAGTSTRVNACIIGGSNPNNWLNYGGVEWRVLGLYDINNDGTKLSAKIITNGSVEVPTEGYTCNPTPESFEEDEWCTIINAVKTGNTSKYNVGDKKEIDLGTTYGVHTVRIANMSTPRDCSKTGFSQSACGFVLEFTDVITKHNINPSGTYKGTSYETGWNRDGWPGSEMYTFVNNDIYNSIPTIVRDAIINTKVVSGHGKENSSNFTSIDKLYLLSASEVYADWVTSNISSDDSASSLTRTLDYYAIRVTLSTYTGAIKKSGTTASYWWLRNPYVSNNKHFSFVASYGGNGLAPASNTYGVSPAFRIG